VLSADAVTVTHQSCLYIFSFFMFWIDWRGYWSNRTCQSDCRFLRSESFQLSAVSKQCCCQASFLSPQH